MGNERVTRVLLVEDNPGDADLVRLACEEAGPTAFDVEHATTLGDALARVTSAPPPDVVLLDLSLPDAVGLEGLRRLTSTAPELPVVVLTGNVDRALGAAALQAGAQDYLLKGPEDAAVLARALRYAIERQNHAARARLLSREQAARGAAEAERERMSVLAAASLAVSHSLDDAHALSSLVSAVVPRFADWCAIRASGSEPDSSEWITAHRDPAAVASVSARLAALSASPDAWVGPAMIAPNARTELRQDATATPVPTPWRTALDELGVRSALVVPVRLIDDVLGVMVFAASVCRFGSDDLAVAEEIGRRAGVAIANCRLYREARLALSAREEFMAVAAHELRTPVAVLQLKLQHVELKQRESVCGTCHHAVPADYAGAARQIARLGDLIDGLLDVSRIVGERVKIQPQELDLGEVARDVIGRLTDLATRSRCGIVLQCAEQVRGSWDRLAMERVFGNLLSNAIKFGGERPVEVRVRSQDAQAIIEVEDHGIGIAPEDVDRIFDRFERAVSWRHFGGLGLGLYITRRLVEEHGGTIAVMSRPAAGSLFTIRLPRVVPHIHV